MVGSPTCRLRNKISITLHGKRDAQPLPAPEYVKGELSLLETSFGVLMEGFNVTC